jgi:hypothetical protein
MAEAGDKASVAKKPANIIGSVIGIALGTYSGIHLLIPLAFTGIAWWGGKKLLSSNRMAFLPAIAVQSGHFLWMCVGFLILRTVSLDLLDPLVLLIGITWLAWKPGIGPIVFLTVFQVLALGVNVYVFAETAIATTQHKALIVHMTWRVLALFLMWQARIKVRKALSNEPAPAGS